MKNKFNQLINSQKFTAPVLQSEHIFALSKEVRIQHNGENYLLRVTQDDNLVLIK